MSSKLIPGPAQRAIGQAFATVLERVQSTYGASVEDCLLIMLALVQGYATKGGLTRDQLSRLAFNVWEITEKLTKEGQNEKSS